MYSILHLRKLKFNVNLHLIQKSNQIAKNKTHLR